MAEGGGCEVASGALESDGGVALRERPRRAALVTGHFRVQDKEQDDALSTFHFPGGP